MRAKCTVYLNMKTLILFYSSIMYFRYTASRPSGAIVLLCYQDPTLKAKVE